MAGPTLASPDDLDSAVLGAFIQSQTLAGLVFHFSCLSGLDFKKKNHCLHGYRLVVEQLSPALQKTNKLIN